MPIFSEKLKENIFAILPILFIVFFVHFIFTPIDTPPLIRFIIGAFLVIIGLSLFLVGVDLGITPLGSLTGQSLTKTNKLWIVLGAAFILGFFVAVAEPGLLVYANQIELVTSGGISSISILLSVSLGLAVLVSLGFFRIIKNIPLYKILLGAYSVIFILAIFAKPEFIAIAFDASGAVTGVIVLPFLLALSVGTSKLKKDSKSSEKDSFGLISIASVGVIIAVLILSLFSTSGVGTVDSIPMIDEPQIIRPFLKLGSSMFMDTFMALLPIFLVLIVMQAFRFKLSKRQFRRMVFGFIYAFIGLFFFFLGVNGGFMEVAFRLGDALAAYDGQLVLILVAFFLGLFTIIAEPSVSILTHQIEDVTAGYVKRRSVLVALSIGVGLAIMAAALKIIIPSLELWHILLPGYALALSFMFIAPKLFVGIAFDAGGVATGPLTTTFILAFIQGVASSTPGADVVIDGFGMIALVALAPMITLQILGIIFKIKTRKEGI